MRSFAILVVGLCCLSRGHGLNLDSLHRPPAGGKNFTLSITKTISSPGAAPAAAPAVVAPVAIVPVIQLTNPPANPANTQADNAQLVAIIDSIKTNLNNTLNAQISQAFSALQAVVDATLATSQTAQQLANEGVPAVVPVAQTPALNTPANASTDILGAATPSQGRQADDDSLNSQVINGTEQARPILDFSRILYNLANRTDDLAKRIEELQRKFNETGFSGLAEGFVQLLPGANSTSATTDQQDQDSQRSQL